MSPPEPPVSWLDDAACLPDRLTLIEVSPDVFFPERGQSARHAFAVCATCPVIGACFDWAVKHDEKGIWGGSDDRYRARYRKGTLGREAIMRRNRQLATARTASLQAAS